MDMQISNLKKQLNIKIAQNANLKENIDDLRREKNLFNDIY